ncbi:MAG TPA: hypothetical protein VFQ97_06325 [Gallionella sp.]|nr:hypothetical protein [Gallionella sp.]
MKFFIFSAKLLSMLLFTFSISGCSSTTQIESNLGIKGAPDWVNKGTNILNDKDGRLFHGVGSASPMGDMALQKSAADDRARAEVARVLSSYMDVVSSDYLSSAKSGSSAKPGDASVTEESVSRQIKALTKVNLAGARIIGSWRDPKSNTIYSIAELDMKHVKSTLAGTRDMNDDLRRYIETSADNIFDRVTKEKK